MLEIIEKTISYNFYSEFERRGIDAGEQKGFALVRIAQGLQKCFEEQQVMIKRSYADPDSIVPVSLSLVVQVSLLITLFSFMLFRNNLRTQYE